VLDSTVVFNEVMYHPSGNQSSLEWIELYNQQAVDMDLSGWYFARGVDYQFPEGTIVPGGGFLVVAAAPDELETATGFSAAHGPWVGRLDNAGETLELRDNSDRVMDVIDYSIAYPWPEAADGSGATLAKRGAMTGSDEVANWTASFTVGGTPGRHNFPTGIPEIETDLLVPIDATWRYNQTGADLGEAWRAPQYADGAWPAGPALLFNEASELPAPKNTPLNLGVNTYYFRTTFDFQGDLEGATLKLRHVIDDGAVFYLNGEELYRYNMPDGDVTFATPSSTGIGNAVFAGPLVVPSGDLKLGENVLAVEVHQFTPGSNDIVFGAELVAEVTLPDPETALPPLAFSETTAVGANYALELMNLSDAPLPLAGFAITRSNGAGRYDFSAQTLPGGARLTLTAAQLGFTPAFGEKLFLVAENDTVVVDAIAVDSQPHARAERDRGRWYVPSASTPNAVNQFSFVNDIVINELMYHPRSESESPWLELFNRGATTVNLSGWRLAEGIEFTFAPGTSIAPGGYLVVAKLPDALRALHPNVTIVGPYSGNLAGSGELVELLDATGNPADSVRYFDDGRWDSVADGGGSSLELRDPFADNTRGEAWAGSDESSLSSWQTYSYRGVPSGDLVPARWNEFVLGLFGAGEILLDDLHVTEVPTGAATEKLQNTNFENDTLGAAPAKWRILGNHQGVVVVDPDDPNNQVLHLTATGATDDRDNHVETTFIGNLAASNRFEYEISFRAKWLAGEKFLNTRLYFNRLARRTELDAPTGGGTPGAPNSRLEANVGPTFDDLRHTPVAPVPGEAVQVSVSAHDPHGVESLTLHYSVAGGGWQNVAMTGNEQGRYTGVIPGQAAASIVQFYISGRDAHGAVANFPAEGAASRVLYKVEDGQASDGALHNLRIIMTAADAADMHYVGEVMSNAWRPATVVYNESEVFYNVGVRLKGSMASRPNPVYLGFSIKFQPDHKFRGVHESIEIDRSGRGAIVPNGQEEILIKHMMRHAGDIPGMYDDLVHIISPRGTENGSAMLMMAEYGDVFLDSQYENGADGELFNYDLIYYQNSTVNGSPEGLKTPVGYAHPSNNIDMENRGADKESYRWHFRLSNNRADDDYSKLIPFLQTMSLTGTALENAIEQVMDVDEWMRSFAMMSLAGAGPDIYSRGLNHNLKLYVRPSDDKVLGFLWDMDNSAFGLPTNAALWGSGNLTKVINIPAYTRLFYGHLQDLMNTTVNRAYMTYWVNHYSSLLPGQNFSSVLNYIDARNAFVRSRLPAEVPFAISTNGGQNFSVTTPTAVIQGDGWINVRELRLAGQESPLAVRWLDQDSWEVEVPLAFGANPLVIDAYDFEGALIASDSITVTSTASSQPLRDFLRVSELMYHPGDPTTQEIAAGYSDADLFEFLEVVNIGTATISLEGARFDEGIDFEFATGDVAQLASGERAVIVRNAAAFAFRYGDEPLVAGQFSGGLNNSGERLRLVDGLGAPILNFTYLDTWHPATDGQGPSLVVRDLAAPASAWNASDNWKPSTFAGGSPGYEEPTPLAGDANHDGQVDLVDLNLVRNNFGASGANVAGDTNGDGQVDLADLNAVRNNFGAALSVTAFAAPPSAFPVRRESKQLDDVGHSTTLWRRAADQLFTQLDGEAWLPFGPDAKLAKSRFKPRR
jgi:hypothetical protein